MSKTTLSNRSSINLVLEFLFAAPVALAMFIWDPTFWVRILAIWLIATLCVGAYGNHRIHSSQNKEPYRDDSTTH